MATADTSLPSTAAVSATKFPLLVMLTCCLVTVVIAVAGVVGAVMYLSKHGKLCGAAVTATTVDPPKKELEAVTHPKPLEPMLINLADDGGHAYLRLGIVLAEEDEPGAKAKEEAKPVPGADAAVRDTMFDVLGRENSAALLAPNGKEALKAELLKAISQRNPELHVKEIYFTDFLVQR